MQQSFPLPTHEYMVVVKCTTYNQKLFIEDALKGFVMQRTNFPFCAIVIDDHSTDGTADIIRKYEKQYPDIIIGFYLEENYYSQKKSKAPIFGPWLNCAKYVALCDGDDYWIDPYKLQKQVDFLESHPDYVLVHNQYKSLYPDGRVEDHTKSNNYPDGWVFKEFLKDEVRALPSTVLIRSDARKNVDSSYLKEKFPIGDLPFQLELSRLGMFYQIKEYMTMYRQSTNSTSHFKDIVKQLSFKKNCYRCRLYFAKKYHEDILTEVFRRKMGYYDYLIALHTNDFKTLRRLDRKWCGVSLHEIFTIIKEKLVKNNFIFRKLYDFKNRHK